MPSCLPSSADLESISSQLPAPSSEPSLSEFADDPNPAVPPYDVTDDDLRDLL
jgi:hypothetical protein